MALRPLFNRHASSVHEFVRRAIAKVKLGHPKPLWYDTIVKHYPPLSPFVLSSEKRTQYPKSGTEMDSDEPNSFNSTRKKKRFLSKEERELLNWRHLFPKTWDDRPLPDIKCPEDELKKDFFSTYPMEGIKCAIDPCSSVNPIQAALDTIKSGNNEISSFETSFTEIDSVLLEEKLARETAVTIDPTLSTIEPNSMIFSELEARKEPVPTRRRVRKKLLKEKIVI